MKIETVRQIVEKHDREVPTKSCGANHKADVEKECKHSTSTWRN